MLATVLSRAQFGMHAPPVTIDVHTTIGLPCLSVVGLAEGAVREAKDRPSPPPATNGLRGASPSTCPLRISLRTAAALTFPSHSRSSPPAAISRSRRSRGTSSTANSP